MQIVLKFSLGVPTPIKKCSDKFAIMSNEETHSVLRSVQFNYSPRYQQLRRPNPYHGIITFSILTCIRLDLEQRNNSYIYLPFIILTSV
jgi:hypothetical protein